MARSGLQLAKWLMHFRIAAKRLGILKRGRHVLIVKNIPLHSQCYSAEQKSKIRLTLIMREVKFLIDAWPTALFPISLQKFHPLYVGCRAFLSPLKNSYNIQYMYNIPQQPLGLSKAGQALILRNTRKVLKSARCQMEAFTTDNYGRRNFTKEDLKEDCGST